MDCATADDVPDETYSRRYTLREEITAADGAAATRMIAEALVPDRLDLALTVEYVFRITGVELNVAECVDNEAPTVDLRMTWLKR